LTFFRRVESPACIELIDTWIDAEVNYKHDSFLSSPGTESNSGQFFPISPILICSVVS